MSFENTLYTERSRSANERNEHHFSQIADAAFAGVFKDQADMIAALDEFTEEIV